MSAPFREQTIAWFRDGESEEIIAAVPEATAPPRRSRLPSVMLAVAWATLLASCAVYLVQKGLPGRHHQPLPALTIPVAK